jgi:hypothetical protein
MGGMREEREEHLAWVQFENEGLVTFPGPGVVEWEGSLMANLEGEGGGGEGEQQVTRDDGLVGTTDDRGRGDDRGQRESQSHCATAREHRPRVIQGKMALSEKRAGKRVFRFIQGSHPHPLVSG